MPPPPQLDRTQLVDHLGLVAGMCDELGGGDVLDQAPRHHPAMRDLTGGEAVNAMVLTGLGVITQALSLVPRCFQNKPTSRLISPRVPPTPLHDDALGRALDTLYAVGVTALYRLMAATAAPRLGLASRFAPLDRPSCHVDGRYHRDEAPEAHVMHSTRGDSRDQGPDLNHVMPAWMVAPQAGIPVLLQPLSGTSRDGQDLGQRLTAHRAQWPITDGIPGLVAARALECAENLQTRAETQTQGSTRVPAPLSDAPAVLAHADPQTLAPLMEGERDPVVRSSYGGVAPRGGLGHSAPRQPQAPRTVDTPLLKPSEPAVKAFKQWCRTALACEADAQQALTTFAPRRQATFVAQSTGRPIARSAQRGRPGQGTPPDHSVYLRDGVLAMRLATPQAHIAQHSCVILATTALADPRLPPQARFAGDTGHAHAERGVRFLNDPQVLAAARSLNKPERRMARLRGRTLCSLGSAALESRIRPALQAPAATFPDQTGHRLQHPPARWVLPDFVGMHV